MFLASGIFSKLINILSKRIKKKLTRIIIFLINIEG